MQTIPNLPKDVVATKYAELQVLSVFERSGYNFCRWTFDGQITQTIEIISPGLVCEDRDNIPNFSLKCFVSEGIINTTLGIRFQLQSDFDIQTECAFSVIDPYVPQASGHFNVAGKLSIALVVEVESRTQRSRPRPRTQKIRGQGQPFRGKTLSKPRTGMLEAKDQGHKRKCSPKKSL